MLVCVFIVFFIPKIVFLTETKAKVLKENDISNLYLYTIYFIILILYVNIYIYYSVEFVFEKKSSELISGMYRTVPLPPQNLTLNPDNLTLVEILRVFKNAFSVSWTSPAKETELDGYQVIWQELNLTQFVGVEDLCI